MNSSIAQFFKRFYVDGVFHTHVSLIYPKGKFQLNREKFEEFWELYCRGLTEEKEENICLGFAEKLQNIIPVLVDVDIKIKETEDLILDESVYRVEHVTQIVEIYQSVLRKIVDNCTDENLICALLEKPKYTVLVNNSRYIKRGFHLHFPNLFLSKTDIEVHLFPRVQDEIRKFKVFEDLGFEDSTTVLDGCTTKNPWLLYGCKKDEKSYTYKLTKIYNSELKEIELEDAFKNYKLYDNNEEEIDIKGRVTYFLPRILSVLPYGRNSKELKFGLPSPFKDKKNTMIFRDGRDTKKPLKMSVVENLKMSAKLLPMLSFRRAEEYQSWMEVGWILYNIGDGSDEALEQWLDFSARDEDKYDEPKCISEWNKMVRKKYTIGTLKFYASIDSPDQYKEFKGEQSEKYLMKAIDGSHHDIACLLFEEYGTEFVCSSVSSKTWYQFTGHRWEEIEEGVFLRERISSDIVSKFAKKGGVFFQEAAEVEKSEKSWHDKVKQVQKIIKDLKTNNHKNAIMRECCDIFYNKSFKFELDTNPYLICFKNGVYDFKTNEFRNGKPEDYLSKSLPVNYRVFDEGSDDVFAVFDFLEKVFPDKSVRQYFMDQASDVFVGGNHQKLVIFWTGEGDNGKSVTQTIFERMLGELAIKFSTTLITGKKTANGAANPELARAGSGVRWAILEEPDNDEEINIGYLKSLSGNDSFFARDLFEKGRQTREIQPMFKLTFICNKLPRFRGNTDKATWNRVRVIPFESTFVKVEDNNPAPLLYEEQLKQKRFPMDTEFIKKIPHLLEPFVWVLLEHRKNLKVRVEPEKVRIATELYRKQNDSYRQFVDECIIESSKSIINITEVYGQFREWFREGFPGNQLPLKNEVKDYFIKLWGESENGKWRGYRIKTIADEIDSGTALVVDDDELHNYYNFTPL